MIEIRIGETTRTPHSIVRSVIGAMRRYVPEERTLTEAWTTLPGFPAGDMKDASGNSVGRWEIKEITA